MVPAIGSEVELGVPPSEKRSSWYCTPLSVVALPPALMAITWAGCSELPLDERDELLALEALLEFEELVEVLEELDELLELDELELVGTVSSPPQAIRLDDSHSETAQRPLGAMSVVVSCDVGDKINILMLKMYLC